MEKTITKIKTLKNRRKLSLPSSSPKLPNSEGGGTVAANGHASNKARRTSDAMYTPTIRPRNNSLSPYDEPSNNNSPYRNKRKVGWSPALERKTTPSTGGSDNEENDEDCDSHYELSSEKLTAMRKSLRSRSIAGTSTPPTQQATPSSGAGFSLMAGLKGVTNVVTVTGSHISGRRLSTPGSLTENSASGTGNSNCRPQKHIPRPMKATHRSKRSESASTFEEEALKLRAIMAGRHGSLPMVVVNSSDYVHCTMTRYCKFDLIFQIGPVATYIFLKLGAPIMENAFLPQSL